MDPAVPERPRHARSRRPSARMAIAATGAALLAVAGAVAAGATLGDSPTSGHTRQVVDLTANSALSANWYESAPYYSVLDSSGPDLGTVMAATGQKAFEMAFILADGGCV